MSAVRADDVVGRQSGDEFAVLLGRVRDEDEAILSAERILGELRRPILLDGRSIVVGGSIGIALATDRDSTAEELITKANAAMYAAKATGKGRLAVYDLHMPTRTWTELRPPAEANTHPALGDGSGLVQYPRMVYLMIGGLGVSGGEQPSMTWVRGPRTRLKDATQA